MAKNDEFDSSNLPGDYCLANSTSEQDREKQPKPKFLHETIGHLPFTEAETYQNIPPLPQKDVKSLKSLCECCLKNEGANVISSSFGALGFSICMECLNNNAEPIRNFFLYFYIAESIEVREEIRQMKAFKDGRYISFDEIVKAWKQYNKTMKS